MRVKNFLSSAAHRHHDADVRLSWLVSLDASTCQSADTGRILEAMASEDESPEIRRAAVERLVEPGSFARLLSATASASHDHGMQLGEAVEARLASLLDNDQLDAAAGRALLGAHPDRLAPVIAIHSRDPSLRAQALAEVSGDLHLLPIVERSRFHDTRLQAAERLSHHDALKSALQACRSRDKVVAKSLQQRLDAEAAAEAERIATQHAITTTLSSLEALGERVWSPQHAGHLQALVARWEGFVDDDVAALQDEFSRARQRVEALLDAHRVATDDAGTGPDSVPGGSTPGESSGEATGEPAAGSAPAATTRSDAATDAGSAERPDEVLSPVGTSASTSSDDTRTVVEDSSGPPPDDAPESVLAPDWATDPEVRQLADVLADIALLDLPTWLGGVDDGQTVNPPPAGERASALLAHARATTVLFDPPFDDVKARPSALQQRLSRIDSLLDTRSLIGGMPLQELRYLRELAEHQALLQRRLDKAKQDSADRVRATHRQFAALSGMVGDGKWGPASSLLRRLQKKVGNMEAAERQSLADKLERAEKQLAEMSDWQDFAARPKLEELCLEMESLVPEETEPTATKPEGSNGPATAVAMPDTSVNSAEASATGDAAGESAKESTTFGESDPSTKVSARKRTRKASKNPAEIAKSIRELQARWKALGPSRAANELWPRFKTAGDLAYAPCKLYFEQKQQERRSKLEARTAICVALEQAAGELEVESPDWRAIQRRINDAKREWSRNRVPGRKPDKALEERFSRALVPFDAALKAEYDANAEAKRALVERVAALASGEINQHSANQAKRLQAAWKQIGVMRRKEDQTLWEAFNGHCRTIFKQHHDDQREKRKAGLEHVYRARDIIKRLRTLSKAEQADDTEVQALSNEFQALPPFPERDARALKRDFRAAVDACSRMQAQASRRRQVAEHEERQRLVELCEQLEYAVEFPEDASDTLRDDVAHAWETSETRVSRDLAARLATRRDEALRHLEAGTRPDYDANESRRRDLLIRLEVAGGADTPAEDKSRRMAYQLENLQAGMTSGAVADSRETMRQLEEDWLSAPPVRKQVHDKLQSRFLKALGR